jgi:hypothetical protein
MNRNNKSNKSQDNYNFDYNIPKALLFSGQTTVVRGQSFPDQTIVCLKYIDDQPNRNNVGSFGCTWRYRMNSAFDPDPAIISGSVSGFAQYAAIYQNYKVLGIGYTVSLCNRENFHMQVTLVPTLTDLGLNSIQVQNFAEAPYSQRRIISAKGGMDRVTMAGKIDLTSLIGKQSLYDQGYNSSTGGNPNTLVYLNIGFAALDPLTSNGGVITDVRLCYHVVFYNRKDIFN